MRLPLATVVFVLFFASAALAGAFDWEIEFEQTQAAADGVVYQKHHLKTSRGSLTLHTVQIDPMSSYALMPVIANNQLNTVAAVSDLAQQVRAVAAINGGFFDTGKTRLPVGLVKIKRRIIFEQFLNRAVLGIDEGGRLHFDRFRLHSYLHIPAIDSATPIFGYNRQRKNKEMIIYTPEFGPTTKTNEWGVEIVLHRISPDTIDKAFILLEPDRYVITGVNHQDTSIPDDGVVLSIHRPALSELDWLDSVYLGMEVQVKTNVPAGWESFPYLLGGGPLLLNNGQVVLDPKAEQFGSYFNGPNARTAVGRTAAGKNLIIVVDKAGGAGGASWEELAVLCRDLLKCTAAMGFDGGGSSTMYVGDEVVNKPAGGAQRRVANILAVVPFENFI
jgi:uncharacterized protein YigE (DUF2233 family)